MISIKLGDKDLTLPSSWRDISFDEYCKLLPRVEKGWKENVAYYSELTPEQIDTLPADTLLKLLDILSFTFVPLEAYDFAIAYENKEFNIGRESYEKLEKCKQAISKAKIHITAGDILVETYLGEKIGKESITRVLGKVAFFLRACQSS